MGEAKSAQLQLRIQNQEKAIEVLHGKMAKKDSEILQLKKKITGLQAEIGNLKGRIVELASAGSVVGEIAWAPEKVQELARPPAMSADADDETGSNGPTMNPDTTTPAPQTQPNARPAVFAQHPATSQAATPHATAAPPSPSPPSTADTRPPTAATSASTKPKPLQPGVLGIRIGELATFWATVEEDANNYCAAHSCFSQSDNHHYCNDEGCEFDHHGVYHSPMSDLEEDDIDRLVGLRPDLSFATRRYFLPNSSPGHSFALELALKLNIGKDTSEVTESRRPGVFVTAPWSFPLGRLLESLDMALGAQECVFLSPCCLDLRCPSSCSSIAATMVSTDPAVEGGAEPSVHDAKNTAAALMAELEHDEAISALSSLTPRSLSSSFSHRHTTELLRSCRQVLVVLDDELIFSKRLWCCYELFVAREENIPIVVWPDRTSDLEVISKQIQHMDLDTATGEDEDEAKLLSKLIETNWGLSRVCSVLSELLSEKFQFFVEAFKLMMSERTKGEPLQARDIARLRALQQQGLLQVGRKMRLNCVKLPSRKYREEELLRCPVQFGPVQGPLCSHPSYIPEVWDHILGRRVLQVNGLCLFSCSGTITPGEGHWKIYFCIKRGDDFQFDTKVSLKLNGVETKKVTLQKKLVAANRWTPLLVGEFHQERDSYREVEVQMESLPAKVPVPKYGLYIDRVRAELVPFAKEN